MTEIVIIAAVILLVIYDIVVALKDGMQNTISYIVYAWSKRYPIIPFAIGVLAGHWFWQIQ